MERKGPLKKMKVIEFGNVIAGPFCAALMADYGADVVKIEMPKTGDPFRQFLPHIQEQSIRWATMGRNKRCITLDLRKPPAREIFLRMVEEADCVIENFKPGTIEKWGVGYDEMRKRNPKVVLVRISGFGQNGPYREKAGFGMPLCAFSGYTALQGFPDRPPVSNPLSLTDYMAGIYGFMGAMSAMYAVKSGETEFGQVVDVSLYEPLVRMMDVFVSEYSLTGHKHTRAPYPSGASPSNIFGTADGKWIIMAASTQNTWEKLVEVMGMPELLTNPKYKTNSDRVAHDDEVMDIVGGWIKSHTAKDIVRILDAVGVPSSQCNEIDDMFADPQFISRQSIVNVPHPVFGKIDMPNIFPVYSDTPCEIRHCGKPIGTDNEGVYLGELNLSSEEFEKLKQDGVI